MAFLDGIQNWSFGGVACARLLQGSSQWEEWFAEETTVSIEPILDSADRYVDIGGSTPGALSLVFAFATLDARGAFRGLRGTVGTLARLGYNPRTRNALLTRTQELASGTDAYHLLSCTFEAL